MQTPSIRWVCVGPRWATFVPTRVSGACPWKKIFFSQINFFFFLRYLKTLQTLLQEISGKFPPHSSTFLHNTVISVARHRHGIFTDFSHPVQGPTWHVLGHLWDPHNNNLSHVLGHVGIGSRQEVRGFAVGRNFRGSFPQGHVVVRWGRREHSEH